MGKVFTITEGLENMGALKTGGQGSVYKGRRIGEIITAVKLLPTPIHTESNDDKNFRDFQNEVEKLKKVNEQPNPHVVKILNSGITESGSFPFIEMEFIEGPDLEELLKPPHDPVFTIRETVKVAEQLSSALAHCHSVAVKHGDIKSNNVKFNIHTGNYILLDFGLAAMSDEQRRTSLRHAGAIEFMAPEQNEGQMLFQTDVYSFGVILYELLAGTVPFPLEEKGETARNMVMVSHMETPPPDLLEQRRKHFPQTWSQQTQERELQVPDWLLATIEKCLQKAPEDRFASGEQLHEHIVMNSTLSVHNNSSSAGDVAVLQEENQRLRRLILNYQQASGSQQKEIAALKDRLSSREAETAGTVVYPTAAATKSGVSKTAFVALLLLTLGLAAVAAFSFFGNDNKDQKIAGTITTEATDTTTTDQSSIQRNNKKKETNGKATEQLKSEQQRKKDSVREENGSDTTNEKQKVADPAESETSTEIQTPTDEGNVIGQYTVKSKAYFHSKPDESTRRDAFIVHWNNALLNAVAEENGFVYVVFTNHLGQTSRGWLRKQDLKPAGE